MQIELSEEHLLLRDTVRRFAEEVVKPNAKKIDAKKAITEETLVESGLVRRVRDGVRLLAKGELTSKIDLTVTGASKTAIEAVEKAGGSVTLTAPAKVAAE